MKIWKKISKITLIILLSFLLIMLLDIWTSRINCVEDISNLTRIKMYDTNKEVFYEINNLHESSYVSIDQISTEAKMVFVEIEDKRFYQHSGFDIYSITRAFFHNIKEDTIIGGSTITQQYVKNIYLSNEKSLLRKIRELYFAIKLEQLYTKEEILEGYLNTIYFSHGIYGIEDAAQYYFHKSAKDLTLNESAILAATIQAPANYAPDINLSLNQKRKNIILDTLQSRGKITNLDYTRAKEESIKLYCQKESRYSSAVLFYKDMVLKEIENKAIQGDNLDIYTFFDKDINDYLTKRNMEKNKETNTAVVILGANGKIISIYGGDYFLNKGFNIATEGSRMIGSTIKPMLYYEALSNGLTATSLFKSEPTTFYIKGSRYHFSNYDEKYENKKITMAYAIATSDNIYALKTHFYIGASKLIRFLESFGIKEIDNYPSLPLGTVSLSLIDLTSIYHTIANLGIYEKPSTISYVLSKNKREYIRCSKQNRKLDDRVCYILSQLLTGTFDTNLNHVVSVTGTKIAKELNQRTAGKSGLTDYDSYMLGYTPSYTVGVWCGNMNNIYLSDTALKTYPKYLFCDLINELMRDNKNIWYEKPKDVYVKFEDPTGFNTGYQKNMYYLYS